MFLYMNPLTAVYFTPLMCIPTLRATISAYLTTLRQIDFKKR
jgi:hypothetical protein